MPDKPTTEELDKIVERVIKKIARAMAPLEWQIKGTHLDTVTAAFVRKSTRDGARAGLSAVARTHALVSRDAMQRFTDWCDTERHKLGAVDGYNYSSGEEYGLRRAAIYFDAMLSASDLLASLRKGG